MVRQLLLCAGVALSLTGYAEVRQNASKSQVAVAKEHKALKAGDLIVKEAKINDGSNTAAKAAAASKSVQWKRPAGQFWGTGYLVDENVMGYYLTPVVLRPWTEYTFENLSTANGTPSWSIQQVDPSTQQYVTSTSNEENVTVSYIRYEGPQAPLVQYKNLAYPLQYIGAEQTGKPIQVVANNTLSVFFDGDVMPVSSHYFGLFSRNTTSKMGLSMVTGAEGYDDMETGYWYGTNNSGINAMATRFEKPDQPYLLNGVYYYYQFFQDVPKDIPMKAYVFKTVNDAATTEDGRELVELGELIAVSESFVPAAIYSDDNFSGAVEFKFIEKNPVTGATSVVSLEIEDDITVVVTGFNADLGNGGCITSCMSEDEYDEGYGNLAFLGQLEEAEDGSINYWLPALKNFFVSPMPNTGLGVLADVSYPWIHTYYNDQPSVVKFANEGDTTDEVQGLQYVLMTMSTSETADFEITYNGEEECEWLSVVDVYDEYETTESGEEEFTGLTGIEFEAAPNPNDETRKCVVKISIPAASYEITFLQGSNAEGAVDVITANGEATYFDLAGRKVANPEKGIYVKVNGNKAEKVVL